MGQLMDLTGKTFGRLTVKERVKSRTNGIPEWLCLCECGKEIVVTGSNLRRGHTTSCGCYRMDRIKEANTKHGQKRRGTAPTPLYSVWSSMKERCYNPNDKAFKHYGTRGIEVCPEWRHSFETFEKWALENGYKAGLTIDREDTNGSYCPENCRWITNLVQQNNKRNNRLLTAKGETHTLAEWARMLDITPESIASRIKHGWSVEAAVTTPRRGSYG